MLIRIVALLFAGVLGLAGIFFLLVAYSFWGSGVETQALVFGATLGAGGLSLAWWAVLGGAHAGQEPPA